MSREFCRTFARVLLGVLFAVCVYRAFTQSITHDEAFTWEMYILGPAGNMFRVYDANHHFLNTLLERLSTALLGVSEWSLRLPALAGAAIFFPACYRLARTAFGDSPTMLLALGLATLNPLTLDFMVAARGYGLALALWMAAAALLLEAFSRRVYATRRMIAAGAMLALAVAAHLVFLPPCAALAGITLFVMLCQPTPEPQISPESQKKKKSARQPATRPATRPWIYFGLPIVILAVLFLILAPVSGMQPGKFYTGAATVAESLRSLASSSLEHSGPLRHQPFLRGWTDIVAFAIAPLIVVAGLLVAILRRHMFLLVTAGTVALSGAALLLIHLLLGMPYPADRTGIYFLPLAGLILTGLADASKPDRGAARAASVAAYALGVIFVIQFATEFNTSKFLIWEYDADTRSIADSVASHRPAAQALTRVGGSWQLQQSLRFYAVLRNWDWIELRNEEPAPGLDFYALAPSDRIAVEQRLGLTEIYSGAVSGSALAKK